MASAKSSRSRVSMPSGPIQASAVDGGGRQGNDVQLVDKLKIFRSDVFNPDDYLKSKLQAKNEQEDIRNVLSYLQELKKFSAEEMRKSAYSNYPLFIRTSKELSDLEGELLSIKNSLAAQATLIHGLAEGVQIDSVSAGLEEFAEIKVTINEDQEHSDIKKWAAELPDMLDVLLAERRINESLNLFDEAERIADEAEDRSTLTEAELWSLKSVISERSKRLADQLAEAACQPSTRGVELRAAAYALKRLGDGPRAHSLLLNAHSQQLEYSMQVLHPTATSYRGAYTVTVSQQIFSTISQALSDSQDVFGNESAAYSSELVIWAIKQAENFGHLVKKHALSAATGALREAVECVQNAIGYCSLLEARGLYLSSVILRLFKPIVEQALDANLKRIEETTALLGAADDWVLTYPPSATRESGSSSVANLTSQPKLSSSAHRFYSMVQDFFEDVRPLMSLQLGDSPLDSILKVFGSYISLLIKAFPGSMQNEKIPNISGNKSVKLAESESQQIAVLANGYLLAEELLPRAAMKTNQAGILDETRTSVRNKFADVPEQREWKRKLHISFDKLRDCFVWRHALDLIFSEDGDSILSVEYINMDSRINNPNWAPSAMFQELYMKLNRIASIASEMFVGRERFARLLTTTLTETVIIWLSEDQKFWADIEQGPRALGPLGIQQFYLDMQFVILFGQGRFISRHVRQLINNIIQRSMTAFYATGMDPDRVLPSDDWFIAVAQETISRLRSKATSTDGERETDSTTPSHASS